MLYIIKKNYCACLNYLISELFYFVYLGAISATGYFTNNIWPFHILDINCTGEEDNIFDCTHNEIENYMCLWSHDASIVCHGQYNLIDIMKHFEMCL